jgi:AraC-like DNA-binding protein
LKELDSMIIKWRENSPRWKARLKDAPLTPHQIAIKQECAEKGHWVVGSDPPKGQDSLIRISMHGPPAAFDREGYMHCHNYFEMIYVYRGHFINLFPDKKICMNQGDIMILNPNVLHCPYVEDEESAVFNLRISNSLIEKSFIPSLKDNQLFMSFFFDYLYRNSETKKMLYFMNNSGTILHPLECMILEYFNNERFVQNITESLLMIVFSLLSRQYEQEHDINNKKSHMDLLVYEIISYINENCTMLTLESLSVHFQYSPSYLSRIIKKATGKTFVSILSDAKLQRAADYLVSTQMSSAEISELCGFSDYTHFGKSFKAKFQKTPSQYRRDILEEHGFRPPAKQT